MPNRKAKTSDRLYTWEEVSWMTGLSIHELLEIFGQSDDKGTAYESLPRRIDNQLVKRLSEVEPGEKFRVN